MASYGFTIYRDAVREGAPTGDVSSRAARVRVLRGGEPCRDGAYVLYWMQMYLRGSENAALDEAVRRANQLGLPLLVYQGLNPDYPEANDRIHTFILACARDVARELAGLVPLIVPVVLLRHYVRRLEVDYLADQIYLQPHPHELMLLNHV